MPTKQCQLTMSDAFVDQKFRLTLYNVQSGPVLALSVLVCLDSRITLDADECPANIAS